MAWKELTYRLQSSCPLLMNNGQTADPLNQYAKALKRITSKRSKTDADYEEMARIEFLGGLYMSPDGPALPAEAIGATIINSAKKNKEGMTAKSGVFCLNHAVLEYDGPRTADELWKEDRFRDTRLVRVGTARIMRTRPRFNEWSATVTIAVEDGIVNVSRLDEWLTIGGVSVGFLDYRPQFGRFKAERVA